MRTGFIALLLAACGSGPAALTLNGKAAYADGTPVKSLKIDLALLANGENLFPNGGDACSPGDTHAQALQVVSVQTNADGSFSATAPFTRFVRATDDTCYMPASSAANIASVDVKVQTNADATTCFPYCRVHTTETCYSDCAGQGQKFVSTTTLDGVPSEANIGVTFASLGPPLAGVDSTPTPLPDLQIDGPAAQQSARIETVNFGPDDCVVADQCIAQPGDRTLLRFAGDILNLGTGDLVIGSPQNNPLFTWSECHQHYHFSEIMSYELLDQTGAPVYGDTGAVVGRKQGFCIEGVLQVAGEATTLYNCDNQGLTPGWEDIYSAALDCQWLDVTGVAPGDYTLKITANPVLIFPEIDYDNNSAEVPVTIP